jgi:hypothetical protein
MYARNNLVDKGIYANLESFLSDNNLYPVKQHFRSTSRKYIRLNCNLYQIK